MDAELTSLSRKAWGDLEVLHVVGYFAPEVSEQYVEPRAPPAAVVLPGPRRRVRHGRAGPDDRDVLRLRALARGGGTALGVGDGHARTARRGTAGRDGGGARHDPRHPRRERGAGDRPGRLRRAGPAGPPAVRRARRAALARGRPARALARGHPDPGAPRRRARLGAAARRARPGRGHRGRRALLLVDGVPAQDPRLVRRGVRRRGRPAARARAGSTRTATSPSSAARSASGSRTTRTGSRWRAGRTPGPSGPRGCTSW